MTGLLLLSATCKQGELDVAERYLKRAASVSTGPARSGRGGGGEEQASNWIALMEFLSERRPPSTRAADAAVRIGK